MPEPAANQPTISHPQTQDSKSHEKMLGYILLCCGLVIIIAATIYAILILTGKIKPAKVFDLKAPEIPIPSASQALDLSSLQNSGLPQQILDSLKGSKTAQSTSIKILPDEAFSQLINMFIAYILVMLLLSTGSKFASIGVSLIKEIKVQAKI